MKLLKHLPAEDIKQSLLSCISIFYIFYAVLWLSPSSEFKLRMFMPVDLWWQFWGLDQNWSLFSPIIHGINLHTTVTLTFADGSIIMWEAPRMNRLSLKDRFQQEKFRKWDIDCLPWQNYKEFWPDFARYIGKIYYNAANKPTTLSLHLHWIEIPPPGTDKSAQNKLPEHTKYLTIFNYRYCDQDFK